MTEKKHISEQDVFDGLLSRNSPTAYRMDCREKLSQTGIYDNAANILAGIQKSDRHTLANKITKAKEKGEPAPARKQMPSQAARVQEYMFDYLNPKTGKKNFATGGKPYPNQAHHIVPCEVFHDKKWTWRRLHIMRSASANPGAKPSRGYNINNKDNIILLPQCYGLLYRQHYHMLPDHSKSHNRYNERVVLECSTIHDKIDEVEDEANCERKKDLRKQLYDMLKQIERNNFNFLKALGARPMK